MLEKVTTGFHDGCIQPWLVFSLDVNVTGFVQYVFTKANRICSQLLGLTDKEVTDTHDLVVLVLQVAKHSLADTDDSVLSAKQDFGFLEVFYGSDHLTGDVNHISFDVSQRRDDFASGGITIEACLHLGFSDTRLDFTLDIQVPRRLSDVVLVSGLIESRQSQLLSLTASRNHHFVIDGLNAALTCFVLVIQFTQDGFTQTRSQIGGIAQHILEDL